MEGAERPAWAPDEVDLTKPSVARVYDYYLGGSHNFAVDRAFAATVLGARGGDVEVQIEDPPVRALADLAGASAKPQPGDGVRVKLERVDVQAGRVFFTLEGAAGGG